MANGYKGTKPDEEWWMRQLRLGIAYRKKHTRQDSWDRWRSYYRGYWPRGTLPVNLFFRMLRTVVPRIYFRNPSVSVTPGKPGVEQQAFAQLIERIDNKLLRSMQLKQQMKMMTQHAWMFGTGAGKRGFGQQFHPAPDILSNSAAPVSKSGKKVEYHTSIKDGMPWFLQQQTGDLIVPAGSRNFNECRWYASWYRRPLEDLQEDPRFKNVNQLHSTMRVSDNKPLPSSLADVQDSEIDLVEVRDTKTEQVFVLAPYGETGKKILIQEDDTLQVNNRSPIYTVVFNPDDEVCWGVPDSVVLEPQQIEMNEIRTLQMKHRRMSIVKLLAKKNTISPTEAEKILNGDVASIIQVDGDISDIDHLQVADVPPGLTRAAIEVMEDVRENMGFSRNQFGNYAEGSADRTATESRIVEAASEIRIDERRDAMADVLVNLFEDVHVDVFDRWQLDIVEQVMGPEGLPLWVAFKPAMLKAAQTELTVDPDSAVPETKDVRTQKAIKTYELLKPNPLIQPDLLTRYLLRELHGVQLDDMMRNLSQLAASGAPGSTQENPIDATQFMDRIARAGMTRKAA